MFPGTPSVRKYFDKCYPVRQSWKSLFFRTRDVERSNIIISWLPSLKDKSLCDVGCGDGNQIRRILSTGNIPSLLVLQDISSFAVARAKENLTGYNCILSELVGDAFDDGFGGPHDVVIAIGITDYYSNWDDILDILSKGTSEVLIIDFPRKWRLRNIPRKIWLKINGVYLNSISYRELCDLLIRHGYSFEIEKSTYNWLARISRHDTQSDSDGYQ